MNNEAGVIDVERVRQMIATSEIKTVRVTFVDNSGVTRARNVTAGMFLKQGLEEGIGYPSAMLFEQF
jgi:glutamine synthetase